MSICELFLAFAHLWILFLPSVGLVLCFFILFLGKRLDYAALSIVLMLCIISEGVTHSVFVIWQIFPREKQTHSQKEQNLLQRQKQTILSCNVIHLLLTLQAETYFSSCLCCSFTC